MPKIIRKIGTPDGDDNQNKINKPINKGIVKTDVSNTNKKEEEVFIEERNTQETPPAVSIEIPDNITPEYYVSKWFVEFFGEDLIQKLMQNPNIKIPYLADDINTEEWLTEAFKTIMSLEQIQTAQRKIEENYTNLKDKALGLQPELIELKELVETLQNEKRKLIDELDDAKNKKFKAEQRLKTTIGLEDLIDLIIEKTGNEASLYTLLKEAVQTPSDELKDFISGFCNGFLQLKKTISKLTPEETENVERIDKSLREFLLSIAGYHIPQRRALLDGIAKYVNLQFNDFMFVSPEETLSIDPSIHNAKGLGGSRIKEGVSFAVLRKSNRQTYKYADITVY